MYAIRSYYGIKPHLLLLKVNLPLDPENQPLGIEPLTAVGGGSPEERLVVPGTGIGEPA